MPLPIPATLPLIDAAKLLRQQLPVTTAGNAHLTGHLLLGWAARGEMNVYVPVGDALLKLTLTEALAHRLAQGEWVPLDGGQWMDGTAHRLPKPLLLQYTELVVRGAELQAFIDSAYPPEPEAPTAAEPHPELEPEDLPEELDIARIAFTAVKNGYGAANATFKNRLLAYLKEHYPKMSGEARDRIATVANPDKAAGRRGG